MLLVVAYAGERHLVRAPGVLDGHAVHLARARPALRRPQHDHRPARPGHVAAVARGGLDLRDPVERVVQRRREALVHRPGPPVEAARDEQRLPPVPLEERDELVLRDPREDRRVRDLVAVQVQDRQDGAVRARVQELVRVPARRERAGLRLAVADDARDEEIRVVEGGAERMRERVAELAALVDRARRLGRRVARNPAREREAAEERPQAGLARADVGVELAVRALEVGVGDVRRAAVTGPGDVDRVQVAHPDRPVEVDVDEVQAGHRPEVAEQPRLDVLAAERLAEEGFSSR